MDCALFGGLEAALDRKAGIVHNGITYERKDPEFLNAVLKSANASVLLWHKYRPLISVQSPAVPAIARLPISVLDSLGLLGAPLVVLGTERCEDELSSRPVIAVDVSSHSSDGPDELVAKLQGSGLLDQSARHVFMELRDLLLTAKLDFSRLPPGTDAFSLPPSSLLWPLPFSDVALLGLARSLLVWGAKARFCGACGSAMTSAEGGTKRICSGDRLPPAPAAQASSSGAEAAPATTSASASRSSARSPGCGEVAYPRTDPVAITLVLHPSEPHQRVLLGRGKAFPPGFYSCLAGFLEAGESVEEGAAREVREEVGLALTSSRVRYHGSQPWPVGRGATMYGQVMLGCVAQAAWPEGAATDACTTTTTTANPAAAAASADPPLTIDTTELADARWFSRQEVEAALRAHYSGSSSSGGAAAAATPPATPKVPGPFAIAHQLLRDWVQGKARWTD